jgi:hypothetical protein
VENNIKTSDFNKSFYKFVMTMCILNSMDIGLFYLNKDENAHRYAVRGEKI